MIALCRIMTKFRMETGEAIKKYSNAYYYLSAIAKYNE